MSIDLSASDARLHHLDNFVKALDPHDRPIALLMAGIRRYLAEPATPDLLDSVWRQIEDDAADVAQMIRDQEDYLTCPDQAADAAYDRHFEQYGY